MKKQIIINILLTFLTLHLFSQNKIKENYFFFSSGPGIANSFFKTAKPPFPFQNLAEYNSKKSIGRSLDFEAGYSMKKRFSITVRYSNHQFSNKFHVFDTLTNSNYEYTLAGKTISSSELYTSYFKQSIF